MGLARHSSSLAKNILVQLILFLLMFRIHVEEFRKQAPSITLELYFSVLFKPYSSRYCRNRRIIYLKRFLFDGSFSRGRAISHMCLTSAIDNKPRFQKILISTDLVLMSPCPLLLRSLHLYRGSEPTHNQTIYSGENLELEYNRNVERLSLTFQCSRKVDAILYLREYVVGTANAGIGVEGGKRRSR